MAKSIKKFASKSVKPATKKTKQQKKSITPPYFTPHGIALPCMPLQLFMDMINGEYSNTFTNMEKATEYAKKSKYEYDVYQGWIVSKRRIEEDGKAYLDLDWVMPLPEGYSVATFSPYFASDETLPTGKWIGLDSVIRLMHGCLKAAEGLCDDVVKKAFNLPFPSGTDWESRPEKVLWSEYESEDLSNVSDE